MIIDFALGNSARSRNNEARSLTAGHSMPLDLATASISAEEVGLIRILPSDDSEKHLIGMFPKERIVFIPGLNGALQRVLLSISSSIFAKRVP